MVEVEKLLILLGVAWADNLWEQGAEGSNPFAPTIFPNQISGLLIWHFLFSSRNRQLDQNWTSLARFIRHRSAQLRPQKLHTHRCVVVADVDLDAMTQK